MTNISGKFVTPGSYSHKNATQEIDPASRQPLGNIKPNDPVDLDDPMPQIPECPGCGNGFLEWLKHYFGALWWVWLIVVVLISGRE